MYCVFRTIYRYGIGIFFESQKKRQKQRLLLEYVFACSNSVCLETLYPQTDTAY